MTRIASVPRRKRLSVLRYVSAGAATDEQALLRARSLLLRLRENPAGLSCLWWARRRGCIQAAAAVLVSRGMVGFLYHSPADAAGVDIEALGELVAGITRGVLAGGASMVQSLLGECDSGADMVLSAAGFEELLELIYMQRALRDLPAAGDAGRWEFRDSRRFAQAELMEVINLSYAGTLDCPRLCGLRSLDEVIASHKATGRFTPRWWWVVRREGRPAGCILVNRSVDNISAEVVYMGVAAAFRGQGLGWKMLCRAAEHLRAEKIETLRLAVDAKNHYAMGLYGRFGFRETQRKQCFAVLGRGAKNNL